MRKRFGAPAAALTLTLLVMLLTACGGGSDGPLSTDDDPATGTEYNGTGVEVTSNDSGLVRITTTHLNDDTAYTYCMKLADQDGNLLPQMKVYYLESGQHSVIVAYDPVSNHTPAVACGTPAQLQDELGTTLPASKSAATAYDTHLEIELSITMTSTESSAGTFVFPAYPVSSFFLSDNVSAGEDYTQTCEDFEDLSVDLVDRIDGNALFKALIVRISSGLGGAESTQDWAMLRNDLLARANLESDLQQQLVQQAAQSWSLTAGDLSARRVSVKSYFDGSNVPSSVRNMFSIIEIEEDTSICSGIGGITGAVTDATTGAPVAGVQVSVSGPMGGVSYTNTGGEYSFSSLPDGNYTVTVSKVGYVDVTKNVTVDGGAVVVNFVITEILGESEYRFVLSWGSAPTDLDAHAWSGDYHVYYMDKGSDTTLPYIALDIDDITSYGPETITVGQLNETLQYAVYNYSGSPSLTTSQATVEVYQGSSLLRTYTVPTTGSGLYWYVCDLSPTSGLIDQDYLTDTSPGPNYFMPKH